LFKLPVRGEGVTGLSPVFATWRAASGSAPAVAAPTIAELDAANAPGWYYFDVDSEEHVVATVDGTATLGPSTTYRYLDLEVRPGDARQLANEVVVYSAWDARGNPTAGTIYAYRDKDALEADTDLEAPDATSAFTATYDAANRLTRYTRTR
jgi:hypothetical protein